MQDFLYIFFQVLNKHQKFAMTSVSFSYVFLLFSFFLLFHELTVSVKIVRENSGISSGGS